MKSNYHIFLSYKLILSILIFSFLSRLFTYFLPIPNITNLLVFPILSLFFLLFYPTVTSSYEQRNNILIFFFSLITLSSTFINNIPFINWFFFIIVICFPFFLFKFISCLDKNLYLIQKIHKILFTLILINILVSLFQYFILGLRVDDIKGLFLGQGLGHHINGVINFFYSIYFFSLNKKNLKLKHLVIISLCLFTNFISDTKTIILAALVIAIIMPIILLIGYVRAKPFRENKIFFLSFFFSLLTILLIYLISKFINIPSISHVNYNYLSYGLISKFKFFSYVNFQELKNYLLGYGPSMATSKIAYMSNITERYDYLLSFLGFNYSDLTIFIQKKELSNFITHPTTGSSLFQLTFSHGAVIAEVGYLGFLLYLFLLINTFKSFIIDYFSFLIVLIIILMGFIFTWLEESIFIVFILCLLICYKNLIVFKTSR